MILLKKLFTPVRSLDAQETRKYMAEHPEGTYTILDVRQPGEYEEAHIPGAQLIPLPKLHDSYRELDPEKPTIVHCAVGGRSRVAAQLLSGLGFKEVYNLAGGIVAYRGEKAGGPQELNLNLVRRDETPAETIILAFGMEKGLQAFYRRAAAQKPGTELADLLVKLADIEERHKQRLFDLYREVEHTEKDLSEFEAAIAPDLMEGGFDLPEFLEKNEPYLTSTSHILELAMMLETQALDLYLRFAQVSSHDRSREVLYRLADEEKAHLALLGRFLDESSASPRGD